MELRAELYRLLGLPPERPAPPRVEILSEAPFGRGIRRELRLGGMPASFLHPGGRPPVVLYAHAHGGEYALGRRELFDGSWWLSAPYAGTLLDAGFAVLALDMPGFGDRQAEGTEAQLAKAGFWQGRPLFGRMIGDLRLALAWLESPGAGVDPGRIAAMGVSMGAAHAYWLAALDDRVGAVVQFCMLADMGPLIASGDHERHGFYLVVPGVLALAEMGDIAGLVAPRPQFVAHGLDDPLAPAAAREQALTRLRAAYAGTDRLATFAEAGIGHTETPAMRRAALAFLADWARPTAPDPGGSA